MMLVLNGRPVTHAPREKASGGKDCGNYPGLAAGSPPCSGGSSR